MGIVQFSVVSELLQCDILASGACRTTREAAKFDHSYGSR
jgi:hypothetical protein